MTVVVINRANVIDTGNANWLFLQQPPLGVVAKNRLRGLGEILFSGKCQPLLCGPFGEPVFLQ